MSHDATSEVLGMLAFSELGAFSRLAADAALAPSLEQRLELSRLAGAALERMTALERRLTELGEDVIDAMEPFSGVLVEFEARTPTSTWWERLLKGYVGYGVSDDLSRLVAGRIDPGSSAVVAQGLEGHGHAELVVRALREAVENDPTLGSRLALWGRRLVGESLGVVQRLLAAHPTIAALAEEAVADPDASGDAQQRLFAVLTAEHARRMERLGLTP